MIIPAGKNANQLTAFLQRVMLLDASQANARMTAELVKGLGAGRIYTETAEAAALETCREVEPKLIITELAGPHFDGLRFVKALRRSRLPCRAAPVIMVTAEATAATIVGARNAGVHEFLRKPFAIRDLARRIEAVLLTRRDWIEAVNYIGPDRRRFNSGEYQGPRKRQADQAADEEARRIEQALKILKSALSAVVSDPEQARRSLQAQAQDLHGVAVRTNDLKLMAAVAPLQRAMIAIGEAGPLSRPSLEAAAAGLWAFAPAESADTSRLAI